MRLFLSEVNRRLDILDRPSRAEKFCAVVRIAVTHSTVSVCTSREDLHAETTCGA